MPVYPKANGWICLALHPYAEALRPLSSLRGGLEAQQLRDGFSWQSNDVGLRLRLIGFAPRQWPSPAPLAFRRRALGYGPLRMRAWGSVARARRSSRTLISILTRHLAVTLLGRQVLYSPFYNSVKGGRGR